MARREIKSIRVSEVPASIRDVYALRSSYTTISPEIQTIIETHMKGGSAGPTGFRDFSSLRGSHPDAEGFQEVRRWGRSEPASRPASRPTGISHRAPYSPPTPVTTSGVSTTLSILPSDSPVEPTEFRFGTYGRPGKREKTFEESEKSKITGVINKISDSNYQKTKAFLTQFLDPDDTSVLTDFVNSVFETAAMSAPLCKICTKLLHELGNEYPHVRVEMLRLFENFTAIFDNIKNPCIYTGDHDEDFLQEQKQIRRRKGYSRFIAELVNLKELPSESYFSLLKFITESLNLHSTEEKYTEQCTAYAECLKLLFQTPLRPVGGWLEILTTFAALKNSELPPGLKPQAKYAILDIIETITKPAK